MSDQTLEELKDKIDLIDKKLDAIIKHLGIKLEESVRVHAPVGIHGMDRIPGT